MAEPIEWQFQVGTSCAYCKDGLCQRMNQLMEDGHSQREASRIMEDEAEGKWKANTIRIFFKREMGTIVPTPQKNKNTTNGGDSEKRFKQKYEAFLKEVQQAHENEWVDVSFTMACDLIGDLNFYLQEKIK